MSMIPAMTEWTIVLVGKWDSRLFTQPVLGQEIFQAAQFGIEVAVGPEIGDLRYTMDSVVLIPRSDRVIIGSKSSSDEALGLAESIARRTVVYFQHVPVTSFGVNLSFRADDPPDQLAALFEFRDLASLAEAGIVIQSSEIRRRVTLQGKTLNLRQQLASGRVSFDFNFHHDVASATAAAGALDGNLMVQCKRLAGDLIEQRYGQTIEWGDSDRAANVGA